MEQMFVKGSVLSMENLMLKINRVKMGLNESEAAVLARMKKENYIDIENNAVEPKLNDMLSISNAFHKSIDDLFNW